MNENNPMWRVFEFRLSDGTMNIVSERPMTDEEVNEVYKRTSIEFDLEDLGVGLIYGCNYAMGCYSTQSKERAEEVQKRLSNGESIWDICDFN